MTTLAQITGRNTIAPLEFLDREAARKNLNSLGATPSLDWVGLFDRNGALFAEFMRSETVQPGEPMGGGCCSTKVFRFRVSLVLSLN